MIELRSLSFSYGKEPFLNIDTVFDDRCLTALIGENGSGKTTLLKLINGIEKPKTGSILIDGHDISQASKKETAKRLSYFPQSRPIPDMSVTETVMLGRYPHGGTDSAFVGELLREVNAESLAHRSMKKLSFGERQRVYMAMLLAQNTKNCVFDEPVSFMDISSAFSMMEGLRGICEGGGCVVCVLHDISLAMSYADRIVIMKNGVIYDDGTPDDLFEKGSMDTAFGIHLKKYESNGKAVYLPLP